MKDNYKKPVFNAALLEGGDLKLLRAGNDPAVFDTVREAISCVKIMMYGADCGRDSFARIGEWDGRKFIGICVHVHPDGKAYVNGELLGYRGE